MALFSIELKSGALGKATRARVIVPETAPPPYPVCYLLHGLSDDESQWTRATRLEEYAGRYPFAIVMPDGARSFYCDSPLGAYETFIRRELPEKIETWFQVQKTARGRVIGGLSMGGYGALKMALKYPDFYGAAFSHSGAVAFARNLAEMAVQPARAPDIGLLAKTLTGEDNDLFALAGRLGKKKKAPAPALYLDCGSEDFLIEANREFHGRLEKLGLAHEFHVHPGTHCWAYWDEHIQESLRFCAALQRKAARKKQ